jgi:methylmalonyl-CoA mutase N-terminal domain/subunit
MRHSTPAATLGVMVGVNEYEIDEDTDPDILQFDPRDP